MKIYILQQKETYKPKPYLNSYEGCEISWWWKSLCVTNDKSAFKDFENDKDFKIEERETTQESWEKMSEK